MKKQLIDSDLRYLKFKFKIFIVSTASDQSGGAIMTKSSLTLMLSYCVNSLRQSDAYLCQETMSSLIQVMVWCRTGEKPLSKPMMTRIVHIYLTHCGLMMLYGDINLGQHWLR